MPAPDLPWRYAIYNAHEPPPADRFGVIADSDEPTPPSLPEVSAACVRSFLAEANVELRNDE